MNRLKLCSGALFLALVTSMSFAADVDLPANAVGEKTQMVLWVDGSALTADKFTAIENSIKDMVPEAERAGTHKRVQMFQKLAAGFTAAGGEALVMSSAQAMAPEAVPGPDAPPPAKQKSLVMVKLKAGVTPEKFGADFRAAVQAIEKEFPEETKESKMPEFDMKDAGGGWAYVAGAETEKPVDVPDAAALAVFKESLEQEKGAAARMGFRITPEQKKQLAAQAQDPSAAFFGGLLTKVQAAKSMSIGFYPGDNSRVEVQMVFEDEAAATGFKESLDKLVIGFSQIMGLAGGGGPDQQANEKQMEVLKAALAPFMMTQKGAILKTSIDVEQVKNIYKLSEQAKPAPAPAPDPAPAPME
jgi:hypothetical protein